MPTAREILDERLVRGEIDEAEYDRLAAKLQSVSNSPGNNASTPLTENLKTAPARSSNGLKEAIHGGLGLAAAFFLYIIVSSIQQQQLAECNTNPSNVAGSCTTQISGIGYVGYAIFVIGVIGFIAKLVSGISKMNKAQSASDTGR